MQNLAAVAGWTALGEVTPCQGHDIAALCGHVPCQSPAAVAGWTALGEVTPLQSSGQCGSLWPRSIFNPQPGLDGAARSDARAKLRTVRLFVAVFHFNPQLDGAGRSDARAKFKAVFLGQLSVAEFAMYVFQLSPMSILGGTFDVPVAHVLNDR